MATIGSKVAMKHYNLAKKNADARAARSETILPSFGNAKQLVVVKIAYKDFVHAQFVGSISLEPQIDGANVYFPLRKKHYGASFEMDRYDLDAYVEDYDWSGSYF